MWCACFPTLKAAEAFEAFVKENSPPLQNRPEIFGRQFLLDSRDEPVGEEERMLLAASFVTAEEAAKKARELGGTAFPAHVDRDSYSLIASLGAIPPEPDFHTAEISPQGDPRALFAHQSGAYGKAASDGFGCPLPGKYAGSCGVAGASGEHAAGSDRCPERGICLYAGIILDGEKAAAAPLNDTPAEKKNKAANGKKIK